MQRAKRANFAPASVGADDGTGDAPDNGDNQNDSQTVKPLDSNTSDAKKLAPTGDPLGAAATVPLVLGCCAALAAATTLLRQRSR